ncbi:MAG: ACP S-malonyltransferase [Cytophagales bacterium]|nr:ACP S-malonyltransferase [Cytophagales bacterium]MDW8383540.1 ACP S-malonyltransferase [Flammeovirgaceae bacterium]
MKKAYVFPGQGSQFVGMGKDLYEKSTKSRALFEEANRILGFRITDVMFSGTEDELKQTKVTQPAIFLHSVILAKVAENFAPDMVAGHSLGEFSALVAADIISFEDGLKLVAQRAEAMQKACEATPGSMAAILGLDDSKVEEICKEVSHTTQQVVIAANYNCPGQLVVSGTTQAVNAVCEHAKQAGAKRALLLPVSGAFHSPLMETAREQLSRAIEQTSFQRGICPIYQNVDAKPHAEPTLIKQNLIKQLTSPVLWTQSVLAMVKDGAALFFECGPGKVLQGLIKKITPEVEVFSL